MSENYRRPSVTENPLPEDNEQGITTHEKPKANRRNMLMIGGGAVTASALLAGGLFLGLGNDAEKTEPRADVGTSAPANPGEQSPTAEPSPTERDATLGLTRENFPYTLNGETYSQEEFVDALEVSAEEYPTPQEAFPVLLDRMNDMVNAGARPEDALLYENTNGDGSYISPDGNAYGMRGITQEFYGPAYTEALIGDGEHLAGLLPGFSPDGLTETLIERMYDNSGYWKQTQNEAAPFRAEFSSTNNFDFDFVTWRSGDEHPQGLNEASLQLELRYTDNGDQNSIGERRSEPGGYRGVETPTYDSTVRWNFAMSEVDGVWKLIYGKPQA